MAIQLTAELYGWKSNLKQYPINAGQSVLASPCTLPPYQHASKKEMRQFGTFFFSFHWAREKFYKINNLRLRDFSSQPVKMWCVLVIVFQPLYNSRWNADVHLIYAVLQWKPKQSLQHTKPMPCLCQAKAIVTNKLPLHKWYFVFFFLNESCFTNCHKFDWLVNRECRFDGHLWRRNQQ